MGEPTFINKVFLSSSYLNTLEDNLVNLNVLLTLSKIFLVLLCSTIAVVYESLGDCILVLIAVVLLTLVVIRRSDFLEEKSYIGTQTSLLSL